jgi:hypothetical protein
MARTEIRRLNLHVERTLNAYLSCTRIDIVYNGLEPKVAERSNLWVYFLKSSLQRG